MLQFGLIARSVSVIVTPQQCCLAVQHDNNMYVCSVSNWGANRQNAILLDDSFPFNQLYISVPFLNVELPYL